MAITPLPTAPVRSDPANFTSRADAFMTALPTFATEANALQVDVNAAAEAAILSAAASAASSTSSIWVSGTTYAIGNVRFSPANFQNYRRKTAGAGTTDPSTDTTNWAILATIPTVTGDLGKLLVSNGTSLSWTTLLPKSWKQVTATGSFTAPRDDTYRFYAFGQGGAAVSSVGTIASASGGGGGCAYGDIKLITNQVATITISAGIVTVTVAGVVVLTAGKGGDATALAGGIAGTASKHASILNGGAFSGGTGAVSAVGAVGISAASGGTSGSVLGAGVNGNAIGSTTGSNNATVSAPGWGGTGVGYAGAVSTLVAGGSIGANGASGATASTLKSSGSTSSSDLARTKLTAFTDPLLADQDGVGAYHGATAATATAGGQGSSGIGSIPANGIGCGGGALHATSASSGAFGCAGGAITITSASTAVGASGYGAGASAATGASGTATATAGAAICLIYQ